jgi:hypothetical protein
MTARKMRILKRKLKSIAFVLTYVWKVIRAKPFDLPWAEESAHNCGMYTKFLALHLHLENTNSPIPAILHSHATMLAAFTADALNATSMTHEIKNLTVREKAYGDWVVRVKQNKENEPMQINNFPTQVDISRVLQKLCIDTMGAKNIPEGWSLLRVAYAVNKYCLQYQVDPVLCLAQGIAESHFALNPNARRTRTHRNIFNWLNTDDGNNYTFPSYEAGIEQYCKTMSREYYWVNDPDDGLPGWVTVEMMLRHDFKRPVGGRYASAGDYTAVVSQLASIINKVIQGA